MSITGNLILFTEELITNSKEIQFLNLKKFTHEMKNAAEKIMDSSLFIADSHTEAVNAIEPYTVNDNERLKSLETRNTEIGNSIQSLSKEKSLEYENKSATELISMYNLAVNSLEMITEAPNKEDAFNELIKITDMISMLVLIKNRFA